MSRSRWVVQVELSVVISDLVNLYLHTKVAANLGARKMRDLYFERLAAHDKTKAALALTQCTFALCDDGCCGWRCRAGHGQCEEHTKDSVQQLLSGGSFNQCNYICDVTGIRCQEHITPEEASKSMSR
jgi:hypothetical protein